jgi:PAS domain S-box-containing protein
MRNIGGIYANPDDRKRAREMFQANGSVYQHQVDFRRKDGSTYAALLSLSPIRIKGKQYLQVLVEDITERKRAENALKESEERYRTLFSTSLEGIGLSKGNQIVDANEALLNIFGYKDKEELFSKPLLDHVAPRSRGLIEERLKKLAAGEPVEPNYVYWIVRKDGEERELEISTGHVSIGSKVYSHGTFRDITERGRAEQEIIRRNQQLLSLHQVGEELIHLADPAEILDSIFNAIGRVLDNRNLYIALYDEEKQYLTFPIYTIKGERRKAGGRPLGNGITEYIIRNRAPLFAPSGLDEKLEELGIALIGTPAETFVAVPMQTGDKIIGVIAVQDYEHANAYDKTDLELLSTFATQAANALENARLFEETSKRAKQFSSLYETVRDLASFTDLPVLLQTIIDRATGMLGSPSGIMYLFDPTREELELVATKASELELGARYSINEPGGMVALAAKTRQPIIVNDYQNWENRRAGTVELGIRAAIQVPMVYSGALIGILGVGEFGESTRKFTEEDARLLTLFAGHAAAAVHNARLLEETKQRADEFAALYDTALDLSAQTKPERLLETVAQRAKTLLNTAAGAVYLYDPSREELELSISVGAPLPIGTRLKLGEGAAGRRRSCASPSR